MESGLAMIETPPVEGKFFCRHVAADVCDLVEIIVDKKNVFYKTVLSKVSASRQRGDMKLLEYYSCKRCSVSVLQKVDRIREAEGNDGRYEYKVTCSKKSYGRRSRVYGGYFGSYQTVREALGFTAGSGYDVDTQVAEAVWNTACDLAYKKYHNMVQQQKPRRILTCNGKDEKYKGLDQDRLADQKHSVRLRVTRLAKVTLASLDYDDATLRAHRKFGMLPSILRERKCAGCGVCMEKRAKKHCRFCKRPRKRRYASVRNGIKRLIRADMASKSRREKSAEQFENDGRTSVIHGMTEDKGRDEVFSELKEDYGRNEALSMMREAGAGRDELEDYYEDMDPGEREEIERDSL